MSAVVNSTNVFMNLFAISVPVRDSVVYTFFLSAC